MHLGLHIPSEKKQVSFSMAIGKRELMNECFTKQRMRTARLKEDKETKGEIKKKGVGVERSEAGTKQKEVPTAYHYQAT